MQLRANRTAGARQPRGTAEDDSQHRTAWDTPRHNPTKVRRRRVQAWTPHAAGSMGQAAAEDLRPHPPDALTSVDGEPGVRLLDGASGPPLLLAPCSQQHEASRPVVVADGPSSGCAVGSPTQCLGLVMCLLALFIKLAIAAASLPRKDGWCFCSHRPAGRFSFARRNCFWVSHAGFLHSDGWGLNPGVCAACLFPVASAGSPAVRCRQAQASRKVWPAARARPLLPPSPQTMGLKTGLPLRSVGSDSRRVPPRRAQVGPCRVLRAFLAVGIRAVCQWPLGPIVSILMHFFGT